MSLWGLQTTVGHRTMADQNLPMSYEIASLVGHFVRPIFLFQHLPIFLLFTNKVGLSYTLLFRMYLCVATITGLKIATGADANANKSCGMLSRQENGTTFLCAADDR